MRKDWVLVLSWARKRLLYEQDRREKCETPTNYRDKTSHKGVQYVFVNSIDRETMTASDYVTHQFEE